MASWEEFKNSLSKETSENKLSLKIAFVYMSLRLSDLVCIGLGDRPDCHKGLDLTDAEVACGLPDSISKRSFVYRDKTKNDKVCVLSVYPMNEGKELLVVLDSPDDLTTTNATIDLECNGDKDSKVVELLDLLRTGPPIEGATPDSPERLPKAPGFI